MTRWSYHLPQEEVRENRTRARLGIRRSSLYAGTLLLAVVAGFVVTTMIRGTSEQEITQATAAGAGEAEPMTWAESLYGVDAFVRGRVSKPSEELLRDGTDSEAPIYRERILTITEVVASSDVGARYAPNGDRIVLPRLAVGDTLTVREYVPPNAVGSLTESVYQFGDAEASSVIAGLAYLEYETPGHWAFTMSLEPIADGFALARTGEPISEISDIIREFAIGTGEAERQALLQDLILEMDEYQRAVDADPNADIYRGRLLSVVRPEPTDREQLLIDEYWSQVEPELRGLEPESPMPPTERDKLVSRQLFIDVDVADLAKLEGLFVVVRSAGGISHIAEMTAGAYLASVAVYPDMDIVVSITDSLEAEARLGVAVGEIAIQEWTDDRTAHVRLSAEHADVFRGLVERQSVADPTRLIDHAELENLLRARVDESGADE